MNASAHANEVQLYDRKNAALSREEKALFKEGKHWGGTVKDMMNKMHDKAVKKAKTDGTFTTVAAACEGGLCVAHYACILFNFGAFSCIYVTFNCILLVDHKRSAMHILLLLLTCVEHLYA